MGGQVLGGGVIVLVAVVLWLVYLVPSWYGRHQFTAAERNAVRLNQALRVLAETSETPDEVRLELNARTALAQQRLARQAQTEREQADLDRARAELAAATLQAKADAAAARERAAAEARAARERPEARRARALGRARVIAGVLGVAALGLAVGGGFAVAAGGSVLLIAASVGLALMTLVVLRRVAVVRRRAEVRIVAPAAVARVTGDLQDVSLASDRTAWTPRELPRPLTASAGSRAAVVLDEVDAREALRRAALDEAMRARAERQRPPSIQAARATRRTHPDEEFAGGPAAGDEAIEAHVRRLLERRASGQ
ncbi:large exoprotein [Microbacterium sp. bgisy203]|uniref:large exoprotein n=1 Tax=Microbacterium sp. bgisy203 TaxID=3413799 RepID=UPI003D71E837